MLRNYFVIALRNLPRNPLQSLIKVLGLAVGVAGCLVSFLIAQYELSIDQFQPDRDRIYRVYCSWTGIWSGENRGVPMALPGKVNEVFTGLESTSFFQTYSARVTVTDSTGSKNRLERQSLLALTAPDYFEVFNFYSWSAGSPQSLEAPFRVVLTESKALTYFGTSDPERVMGRTLTYADSLEVTVVGLVKDVGRTDFEFTDFISFSTIKESWLNKNYNTTDDWSSVNSSSQFFIKLSLGTEVSKIEAQLPVLTKATEAAEKDHETKTTYRLEPLSDLHFNTTLGVFDNGHAGANLQTLRGLCLVALLLLLVAAINFINLETAQAIRRAKEVGLRKVMGGTRPTLIMHFMGESLLVTSCAVLLALPLTYLSFLLFSEFLPQGLSFTLANPFLWEMITVTTLVVAVLSGLYPSLVLSSFTPVAALKGQMYYGRMSRSAVIRKGLTIFQFAFSQVLIVGAIIVNFQIGYMLSSDLGFAKEAILTVQAPWWESSDKGEVLRNELTSIPEVLAITRFDRTPASNGWSTTTVKFKIGKEEISFSSHIKSGDTSYLRVFRIPLVAGRNVQPKKEVNEFLVNETFCKEIGLDPLSAIGQPVLRNDKEFIIVGVMRDFHFQSLHHTIEPLFYRYEPEASGFALQIAAVNGRMTNMKDVLEKVNSALRKVYPSEKIEPQFFDDTIRKFYESEQRIAKLTNTATGLAIFISCLGLLGLASFTASQRTKEIGIRKVLGATVNSIVVLLSKEFLILVALAFVIAAPIAWYTTNQWLADYAYRIAMPLWIFVAAGLASVIIAFVTVAFQSLKAAVTDPVDSLRYE